MPDEFYDWVVKTKDDLTQQYQEIIDSSNSVYKEFETRKETALYFSKQKYPAVLFKLLDKKDPSDIIWKIIKPKHSKPFKEND